VRHSGARNLDLAVPWSIRYLWGEPYTPLAGVTREGKQTPVIAVAIVLIGIGLFAFFTVLMRLT
jgi:putative membrane protein